MPKRLLLAVEPGLMSLLMFFKCVGTKELPLGRIPKWIGVIPMIIVNGYKNKTKILKLLSIGNPFGVGWV